MIRRLTLPLAIVATASLLVAACGGSATPAPSGAAANGSPAPGASQAPAASAGTGASGSRAPGASGAGAETGATTFGTAADNLDKLSSYKFSVVIHTTSVTTGAAPTTTASRTQMSGTVVNTPSKAYTLTMDDDGDITGIVVVGADAWVKEGTKFQQVPAVMADTFAQTFALYRPEKLFSLAFGVNGSHFTRVGEENKNGVATIHFKGDDSLSSIYAVMFGVNASFSSDVWIAKDGGYIVSSEIRTGGTTTSGGGSYSSVVNITDINSSANKVDKPS